MSDTAINIGAATIVLLIKLAIVLIFIGLVFWSYHQIFGQEALPCVDYKSDKLAVIKVEDCNGFMQSMSSLLFEGYHIDVGIFGYGELARIYMSR